MAKDPAFLFYTGDFSTGTQFFDDEQLGKYLRLLMAQHQHGHLSEKQMLHICKSYDKDIFIKFDKDDNGLFFNKRLEEEIDKRKAYTSSRSNNKSGRKSTKNKDLPKSEIKSYDNHMEDENKDIDDNIDLIDFKNKKSELCILLVDFFEFNGNHFNRQRMEISDFVKTQIVDESFYNHFIQQFKDYQEYKELTGEQKHHFDSYLGHQKEQFLDGQWNKENWGAKIIKFKGQNKSKTEKIDDMFEQAIRETLAKDGNTTV